jgi:hypothetical protein
MDLVLVKGQDIAKYHYLLVRRCEGTASKISLGRWCQWGDIKVEDVHWQAHGRTSIRNLLVLASQISTTKGHSLTSTIPAI